MITNVSLCRLTCHKSAWQQKPLGEAHKVHEVSCKVRKSGKTKQTTLLIMKKYKEFFCKVIAVTTVTQPVDHPPVLSSKWALHSSWCNCVFLSFQLLYDTHISPWASVWWHWQDKAVFYLKQVQVLGKQRMPYVDIPLFPLKRRADSPIISKRLANKMIFLVVLVLSDQWPNNGPARRPLRLNADRDRPRK